MSKKRKRSKKAKVRPQLSILHYFFQRKALLGFLKLSMLPIFIAFLVLVLQIIRVNLDFELGKTIALDEYSKRNLEGFKTTGLLSGEKVRGSFRASENNLGLVLVRFFNFYDISSDEVVFRIKERSASAWLYEASHRVDQFQPNQYFPFGFPEIKNSKGVAYVFEIESKNGQVGNAIGLSKKNPAYAAAYKFYKQDLEQDKLLLSRFLIKKLFYGLHHANYLFVLLAYFSALILLLIIRLRRLLLSLLRIFVTALIQGAKVTDAYTGIRSAKDIRQFEAVVVKQLYHLYITIRRTLFKRSKKPIQRVNSLIIIWRKKRSIIYTRWFYFVALLFIIMIALLLRLEYYINPDNSNDLIYSGIGGQGDYDRTFRNAWSYLYYPGKLTYHLSFENDQVLLSRMYGFFFAKFGFLNGLHYSILFFNVISALVCTVPFLVVTRLKRFSYGAFLASMLFAVSPLSIWLASARIIDTFTIFFFSIYIFLFIIALEKKKLMLLILLGLVGFIDGFNRGVMFFNDGPALLLFALLFLWQSGTFHRNFPFIRFRLRAVLLALTPFAVFVFCYSIWYLYFTATFGYAWFFGPKALATDFNPVVDEINVIGNKYTKQIFNYFLLNNLTLLGIASVLTIPFIFIIGLALFIVRSLRIKLVCATVFLILLYTSVLFSLKQLLPKLFSTDLLTHTSSAFLKLGTGDFVTLFSLLVITSLVVLFLRRAFFTIAATISPYLLVLAYGLYISFSERHFIQVVLVIFIVIAFTFHNIIKFYKEDNFALSRVLIFVYFIALSMYVAVEVGKPIFRFANHYRFYAEEKTYLTAINDALPKDAVILVGNHENPIWIANTTKRTIVYNINDPGPITIPYTKGWFYIEYSSSRRTQRQLDFATAGQTGLSFPHVLAKPEEFNQYNIYILDHDIKSWQRILSEEKSGHPFFKPGIFTLRKIDGTNSRPIYKLEFKS